MLVYIYRIRLAYVNNEKIIKRLRKLFFMKIKKNIPSNKIYHILYIFVFQNFLILWVMCFVATFSSPLLWHLFYSFLLNLLHTSIIIFWLAFTWNISWEIYITNIIHVHKYYIMESKFSNERLIKSIYDIL